MRIYGMKITEEIEEREFIELLNFVDDDKKHRIKRIRNRRDSEMCLMGDLLTRMVLEKDFNISRGDISFIRGEKGKPEIQNNSKGIHFNYSHSEEWLILAVGTCEVGIDIEKNRKIDLKIADRFFTEDECYYIKENQGTDSEIKFFRVWTLKESFFKWTGKGITESMKSVEFKLKGNEVTVETHKINRPEVRLLDVEEGYTASICAERITKELEILRINKIELIKFFI